MDETTESVNEMSGTLSVCEKFRIEQENKTALYMCYDN